MLSLVPLVPLVYHTEQELEHSVSVVLESAAVATGEVLDEFWKLSPSSCSCFIPNDSFCFPGYPLGGD